MLCSMELVPRLINPAEGSVQEVGNRTDRRGVSQGDGVKKGGREMRVAWNGNKGQ